jgi:hypothetical protein
MEWSCMRKQVHAIESILAIFDDIIQSEEVKEKQQQSKIIQFLLPAFCVPSKQKQEKS